MSPQNGFLFLDKSKFAASFAGDADTELANFMANSQVPRGMDELSDEITDPAWSHKPRWYLLVSDDKMIPLPAQQFMCTRAGSGSTRVGGSYAIYVSNPAAVASRIETAAKSPKVAAATR